jgi:3-hydroxyacyl-[acyl-carrier-protein] dehydratase
MRFALIDRITDLEPGVRITAVKSLSMSEEYLADHFPLFPVIPGVLMLEAMAQAGAWLVRATEDFAHSIVVLKEASNVKYGQFLEPGQRLVVIAELVELTRQHSRLKAKGLVEGRIILNARLVLQQYNLADTRPDYASTDRAIIQQLREWFAVLYQPELPVAVPAAV